MNLSRLLKRFHADQPSRLRSPHRMLARRPRLGRVFEAMENRLLLSTSVATGPSAPTSASSTEGGYVDVDYSKDSPRGVVTSQPTPSPYSVSFSINVLHANLQLTTTPAQLVNGGDLPSTDSAAEGGFIAMAFSGQAPRIHNALPVPSRDVLVLQAPGSVAPPAQELLTHEPRERLEASRGQSQAFELASCELSSDSRIAAVEAYAPVDHLTPVIPIRASLEHSPHAELQPSQRHEETAPSATIEISATEAMRFSGQNLDRIALIDDAWQHYASNENAGNRPAASSIDEFGRPAAGAPVGLVASVDFAMETDVAAVSRWERSSMAQELGLVLLMVHFHTMRRSAISAAPTERQSPHRWWMITRQ